MKIGDKCCKKMAKSPRKPCKMKPEKSPIHTRQRALFDVCPEDIVDMTRPWVQLAGKIDWRCLERDLGAVFHEYKGAPAKSVRLMAGLQKNKYCKFILRRYSLSRFFRPNHGAKKRCRSVPSCLNMQYLFFYEP